ncbi:MAG TPA: hypothetical protein VKQ31_08240, partial [Steroidobacteraceae bacterium]|nr:hypothetical protein [Steroidobacteraceae bacterium]
MTAQGDPKPVEVAEEGVRGERTTAIVHAAQSAQSRMSSLLAAALMIVLGLSALGWYYAHALTRSSRVRQQAQSASTSRAQGEMPLPSLGRIGPPPANMPPPAASAQERSLESAPASPQAEPIAIPRDAAEALFLNRGGTAEVHATQPSRAARALARRLAGGVLAREPDSEAGHV